MHLNKLKKIAQQFYKLSQENSPTILVEPYDTLVEKAVKRLREKDPNFFVGVKKIVVAPSPQYGHVSSDEHTVVHLNASRVKSELSGKPEEQQVDTLASIIAHEVAHVKSFKGDQFVGGETPAQAAEKDFFNWVQKKKPA